MARFYVEHNGEWNIFSTIVDDFLLDEFVCIDALKARLLYERYKELTEDIDSLMTDRPRVNVMSYTEATERIRKTEPQTDCGTCKHHYGKEHYDIDCERLAFGSECRYEPQQTDCPWK